MSLISGARNLSNRDGLTRSSTRFPRVLTAIEKCHYRPIISRSISTVDHKIPRILQCTHSLWTWLTKQSKQSKADLTVSKYKSTQVQQLTFFWAAKRVVENNSSMCRVLEIECSRSQPVISTDTNLLGIPHENLKCLQSLYLSDPQDDLVVIRSAKGDRVPGTCEWILTQDRYTSWLVEDGLRLLWLSGGPGIGKTMISSFLVEELARLVERSSQMTLVYYFCDDKDKKRKTATAILRGLFL